MKRTVILVFACVILASAILACGEASTNTGTVSTSVTQAAPTTAPAKHFTSLEDFCHTIIPILKGA